MKALKENQNANVVYMDFAEAFDKGSHGVIAHKMRMMDMMGKVTKWIFNFDKYVEYRVGVNKMKSNNTKVKSSIPQGMILVTLPFHIFIVQIKTLHGLYHKLWTIPI